MTSQELELAIFGASITMAALGGPLLTVVLQVKGTGGESGPVLGRGRIRWLWVLTAWFVIVAFLSLIEAFSGWPPFEEGPALMFGWGTVGLLGYLWIGLGLGE